MKKIILTLAITFSIPSIVFAAFAVGWNATSTTAGKIQPNRVNGVEQSVAATYFTATSTTATSTFAGGITAPNNLNGSGADFSGLQWMRNPGKLVINGSTEATGVTLLEVNTVAADVEQIFHVTDTTVKVINLECLVVGGCQVGLIGNPLAQLSTQSIYLSDFTPGLVHYTDAGNLLAEDATFSFDATANRLTVPHASTTQLSVATRLYAPVSSAVLLSATSTMGTGTTTIKVSGFTQDWDFTEFGCTSYGTGTFKAQIGDSTSTSTLVTSSTNNTTTFTTLSANNSFLRGEAFYIAFGSVSGAVSQPSCSYTRLTK